MKILVINCGSSSIKAEIISSTNGDRLASLKAERLLSPMPVISINGKELKCPHSGFDETLEWALNYLKSQFDPSNLKGVGHRVVHGGDCFSEATLIDEKVIDKIGELSDLAPLHNPINLKGIEIAQAVFREVPHIAVFDTAFHQTLPRRSQVYAINNDLAQKHKIRRYGFHGTSHDYVSKIASNYLQTPIGELRLITCHLGNGCSVAAIEYGRSIETSMGMTPLEGLVMGTRSGDIDPGALFYLADKESYSKEELDNLLNKESGLKGLSGVGNDMRDIISKASEGDKNCQLALNAFTHRLRKYIGAYAAVMGGVDAIIFTGGIGENSPVVRHRASQRLDYLGAIINEDKNREVKLSKEEQVINFSMNHSRCKLLAIQTDEQFSIAKQATLLIQEKDKVNSIPPIPIAISARHVHLSQETIETLFGKEYELTVKKWLSQPGQFAANETVAVVGPKNTLERVRVLGPARPINQVEISRTDEYFLGIDAPVRASGKIENTPGATLIGPEGKVELNHGVICAWRHIHMTPEDAIIFGVEDKDIVEVKVADGERSLIFGNVLIRVSSKYVLEMHIDTDEGNAAELGRNGEGVLLKVSDSSLARLNKRKLNSSAKP